MMFIVKFIAVVTEVFLMMCAIVSMPIYFMMNLYYHIRYGDEMENWLRNTFDAVRTLYGYVKEIVAK